MVCIRFAPFCSFRPQKVFCRLFFSVPAVGAEFARGNADGGNHIVQTVIAQRSEFQFFADIVKHLLVVAGIRVAVVLKDLVGDFSFTFLDYPACDQIHLGFGTGEVQIFAAVYKRRTRRAHMDFLCAAPVEEFCRLPELRAPHN